MNTFVDVALRVGHGCQSMNGSSQIQIVKNFWLRWQSLTKEGSTVSGDFEMIQIATGDRLVIKMDGTELRDQITPPILVWCDKGEHWSEKSNGSISGKGASELWFCFDCRRK